MPEIIVGIVLFVGGYLLGHWAATQSNRDNAEYWARFIKQGDPNPFHAKTYKPETPEERIDKAAALASAEYSKDTVDRGVKELEALYRDGSQPVPSREKLEDEVKMMLNAAGQGDNTIE